MYEWVMLSCSVILNKIILLKLTTLKKATYYIFIRQCMWAVSHHFSLHPIFNDSWNESKAIFFSIVVWSLHNLMHFPLNLFQLHGDKDQITRYIRDFVYKKNIWPRLKRLGSWYLRRPAHLIIKSWAWASEK